MTNLFIDLNALWHVLAFLLLCLIVWLFLHKKNKPYLLIANQPISFKTLRERVVFLSPFSLWVAFFFLIIAYLDPHYYSLKKDSLKKSPSEGISIYLVLDISQSMLEPIVKMENRSWKKIRKLDYLKSITSQFIEGNQDLVGRKNDLIGIVTFARKAQIISPLTLDHQKIIPLLKAIDVDKNEEEKGTALGYAIFKTSQLIETTRQYSAESPYSIKNSVIILITDGFQEINPKDYDHPLRSIDFIDAIQIAKKLGIKVYIINIDPKFALKEYADYRKLFELSTQLTGGAFYYIDEDKDLTKIFKEIDTIEKSSVSPYFGQNFKNNSYDRNSFYSLFITLGLIFLFIYVILETLFIRRIP